MADTKALVQLIEILEPLAPEDRLRNINAALTALGDPSLAITATAPVQQHLQDRGGGQHAQSISARMQQNNVPAEHAERVFHFHDDGTFGIITVPGKNKREQTLNMYVLIGLGTFLTTGQRDFADAAAREACKAHGCYDQSNHAATLKSKHPAFIAKGDDWSLTFPGLKEGAALLKEVANAAAKS